MKPIDDWRQRIGLRPIVGFASFAAMPYQFCFFQGCEVLGDSGLGYACIAREGVYSLFSMPGQFFEDAPASGVGQRAEDVICVTLRYGHKRNHSQMVMDCQLAIAWGRDPCVEARAGELPRWVSRGIVSRAKLTTVRAAS